MVGEVKNMEFPDVETGPRLFPAPPIGTKRVWQTVL